MHMVCTGVVSFAYSSFIAVDHPKYQHVSCIVAVGLFDGILVICRLSRMGVRCHSVRLDSGSNVSMSIFSKDNFTQ